MNDSNQPMIEVMKSGQVLTVVPKENEAYYRDVEYRGHPDEKKISYRPYKTPEERAAQKELIVKKIDLNKEKADRDAAAAQLVAEFKGSIANDASNPITNVTEEKPNKPQPLKKAK